MKGIIKRIGMLAVMLQASLAVSAYDFEVDGIYYNIVSFDDMTCEVTSDDNKYQGDIVIPSFVEYNTRKLSVIKIGESAFKDCTGLTSVTLPESLTTVGRSAFSGCSGLSSITFPESLPGIGPEAFKDCTGLTSVTIPETCSIISWDAFSGCSGLTSVTFPESLTSIGDAAFENCTGLTSVTLPESLTYLGDDAFEYCTRLTSVTFPENLTTINYGAFNYCSSLSSVSFPENLTTIKGSAFKNCRGLTSVTFPKNITSIGAFSFEGCKNLHSIQFEDNDNPVSIEGGAFHECTSLEKLKLPKLCMINSVINESAGHSHDSFYVLPKCNMKYLNTGNICITCYNIVNGYIKELDFMESVNKCKIDTLEINNLIWSVTYSSDCIKKQSLRPKVLIFSQEYNTNRPEFNISDGSKYKEWATITIDGTFEKLISKCLEPPIIPCDVSNIQFINAEVEVPIQALEKYQQAPVWKNFWNLKGVEGLVGIEESKVDAPMEVGRYDLTGKTVSKDYHGIVIVRYSDGSTSKMVQR